MAPESGAPLQDRMQSALLPLVMGSV